MLTPQEKEEWKKKLMDALTQVYDPEIPVDIVNLGLIYELNISDEGDVYIRMGLTAPGCPVVDDLIYTVEQVVRETVPAKSVQVDIDIEKQWTPLMMTPQGREKYQRQDVRLRHSGDVGSDLRYARLRSAII
jgi:Predicted metal-sulfur cluster biosynthetic enzyme